MVTTILDELEWRGLIAQSTDRETLSEQLAAGPITVYSGFDPTAGTMTDERLAERTWCRC